MSGPNDPSTIAADPWADDARDASSAPASLSRGMLLGNDRYRVDSLIGAGGMGAVYSGEQLAVHRKVAIKVIHPHEMRDPDMRARFTREAMAVSRLKHPNIVTCFDFGTTESGLCFLVLEYLEGRSLRDELGAPIEPLRAVAIMRQVVSGLSAAHQEGIVHRDLKPANVQLVEMGKNRDFVKILDFGISKFFLPNADKPLTSANQRLGTPKYMSPEQVRGQPVDHRADIYAAGCVLYEMLVGRPVFEGSERELLERHAHHPPPRFAEVRPDLIDQNLESIVRTMLAKMPGDRFQSGDAVDSALGLWAAFARTEPLQDVTRPMSLAPKSSAAAQNTRAMRPVTNTRTEDSDRTDIDTEYPIDLSVQASEPSPTASLAGDAQAALDEHPVPNPSSPDAQAALDEHPVPNSSSPEPAAGSRRRSNVQLLAVGIMVLVALVLASVAMIVLSVRGKPQPVAIAPMPDIQQRIATETPAPVQPASLAESRRERPAVEPDRKETPIRLRAIRVEVGTLEQAEIERLLRSRERDLAACFKSTQKMEQAARRLRLRFMSSEGRLTIWASPKDATSDRFSACVEALKPPLGLPISQTRAVTYFSAEIGPGDER